MRNLKHKIIAFIRILLYQIKNNNINIYVYFDIFYRNDKNEDNKIIKLKDNIYCINKYYYKLNDDEITDFKKTIESFIIQLLD